MIAQPSSLAAVAVNGSPKLHDSRSGLLLDLAAAHFEERGIAIERIDLARLPANALLGRGRHAEVDDALHVIGAASLVLVATPIYRGTYSGLLKVFFDLLPEAALAGKVGLPIATGGSPRHQLAVDHGLRPLLAASGALAVATGIYASPENFADEVPERALVQRIDRAVDEAILLARAARVREPLAAPVAPRAGVTSLRELRRPAVSTSYAAHHADERLA